MKPIAIKSIIIDELNALNILDLQSLQDQEHELTYVTSIRDTITDPESVDVAAVIYIPKSATARRENYKMLQAHFKQSIILSVSDFVDVEVASGLINKLVTSLRDPVLKLVSLLSYIGERLSIRQFKEIKEQTDHFVLGKSSAMEKVYQTLKLVAPTDYSVIIYGETGTGKESMARMIHQQSKRKDGPFIAVDCGCMNGELAASELFGHVKGAFTDAVTDRTGVFELANGGTLFLDEIGNMPYEVQVKLLRVLQEKLIRKTGAITETKVDVRIITATNENIHVAIQDRTFRDDLYHRLNEVSLYIPPLRERTIDLPELAGFFLKATASQTGKPDYNLSDEALEIMMTYHWPGNIRELKNMLKKACLLAGDDSIITEALLPEEMKASKYEMQDLSIMSDPLKEASTHAEYVRILEVLKSVQYNKRKAAEILNIHRKTLYNKLRSMNIIP
jgi:two-component system, NtrC family, response regulator HydG